MLERVAGKVAWLWALALSASICVWLITFIVDRKIGKVLGLILINVWTLLGFATLVVSFGAYLCALTIGLIRWRLNIRRQRPSK
jgi:hypothetical protein